MNERVLRAHNYIVRETAQAKPKVVPIKVTGRHYDEPAATLILPSNAKFPLRNSVARFALLMDSKLTERIERKGGGRSNWIARPVEDLLSDLTGELEELQRALESGDDAETAREAADVANYAMMIADVGDQLVIEHSRKATKVEASNGN